MRKEGIAMNILFVCSGNTCRSAMAEGIAKQIIQSDPKRYRQIRVASAGTYTADGESASLLAKEVASKHGVDLEHFASRQVTPALLAEADLVLAMTTSHKKLLNTLAPQAMDKIFLLKEYEYGEDVNGLNIRLGQLFEQYTAARENFVKGHQAEMAKLDELSEKDPAAAEALFSQLNGELTESLKAMDGEINTIHEKLQKMEIADPFGGDKAEYEACYIELAASIAAVFERLTQDKV